MTGATSRLEIRGGPSRRSCATRPRSGSEWTTRLCHVERVVAVQLQPQFRAQSRDLSLRIGLRHGREHGRRLR
jgi:hypothetical protein